MPCLDGSPPPPRALMPAERTPFPHHITTEKPSGLPNMKLWTSSIAKPSQTRDRSLTFGPGTRDMSSVTIPHSHMTNISPTTAHTPSITSVPHGDENNSLEELQSILQKWGSSAVSFSESLLAAVTYTLHAHSYLYHFQMAV